MLKRFALFIFCAIFSCNLHAAEPFNPYEVVWTSPSRDVNGTMPLGNGELALNAWIDEDGILRFYIARGDTISEDYKLLKIGAACVRLDGVDAKRVAEAFRQRLDARRGVMEAEFGSGEEKVAIQLWIDPDRPVAIVEIQTARPSEAEWKAVIWRTATAMQDPRMNIDVKPAAVPDTILDLAGERIGWLHRNPHSRPYDAGSVIQGYDDFPLENPLLHRTFGAVVRGERAKRIDDTTLRSPSGTSHRFEMAAVTQHPATEAEWTTEALRVLEEAERIPIAERRGNRDRYWNAFWNRSRIHITPTGGNEVALGDPVPVNEHPVRIGLDQGGGSRFDGSFGRVALYEKPFEEKELLALAALGPTAKNEAAARFQAVPGEPATIPDSNDWRFAGGFTFEAWIKPRTVDKYMRLLDKITIGKSDGILFDVTPQAGLRLIMESRAKIIPNLLVADRWQHVVLRVDRHGNETVLLDGVPVPGMSIDKNDTEFNLPDTFLLSRAYALQRYIAACAARGRLPIKFNGTLFTVPHDTEQPGDPDYRRWGAGYWFQNTRLPYYSMPTAGDFEMMQPFFRMYFELLPFYKHLTKKYLDVDGAFYPEVITFWGENQAYGSAPWDKREDKLQVSGYHKREWVGGLEIVLLMLDYAEYTGDEAFLKEKAIPFAREIIRFFESYYPLDPDGKLKMYPAQALETWWDCTNPMPEIAGLHAITQRLLALPEKTLAGADRTFCEELRKKLPPLPLTDSPDGKPMLAPAARFEECKNVENPELYAVFPFRLVSFEKPNAELGREALKHRKFRGASGWRQDELFMSYLGDAGEARKFLLNRARHKHPQSRFPVFWGPNYDWIPDQDHGSVLVRGVQTLLLQCEGKKLFLFPAWPEGWDVDFKLHAPYGTTVEAKLQDGKLIEVNVSPESRRQDVVLPDRFRDIETRPLDTESRL